MITGGIGGHKLWIIYSSKGWQVYKPGIAGITGPTSKDGTAWVWVGALRSGNHQ